MIATVSLWQQWPCRAPREALKSTEALKIPFLILWPQLSIPLSWCCLSLDSSGGIIRFPFKADLFINTSYVSALTADHWREKLHWQRVSVETTFFGAYMFRIAMSSWLIAPSIDHCYPLSLVLVWCLSSDSTKTNTWLITVSYCLGKYSHCCILLPECSFCFFMVRCID